MALVVYDRVQETTATTGTGTLTLGGAVAGFQTFAVVGNGNTTFYCIINATDWEVGIGTYSSTGPTLARTTVLSNSLGTTSPITLVGASTVFCTYPSEKSVNLDASGNVSPLGTITSGVWNGTTVGVAYGGTGVTSSSGANSVVLRDANSNVTFNNYIAGAVGVTAAAGTTVLTVSSARTQILVGSTTQTFQLPDATTVGLGQSFIFVNNSSGLLTVKNNAGTTIESVPSGGVTQMGAVSIATSAGAWGSYSFIPAAVDWGTNALNLASTVISGGTWQGGVIGTPYGGTGLSTYTSGGALYATSSSTLTSGTLPVTAGGTGQTSFSSGYIPYGNSSAALQSSSLLQFNGSYLVVGGGGVLGGATNPIAAFSQSANNYVQTYTYNPNTGTSGSSDFVAYTDNSTDAHGWGDMGYTSSTYADPVYTITGPNEAYLLGSAPFGSGTTGNLVYATDNTGTANAHQWYVGGFTQAKSAWKMQLTSTGLQLANALATAYGGTGLTGFTAANNAIYSTSSSVLTAGTLPIAAGGTGLSSYTAGDLVYFSTGTTLTKLGIGTIGQVLTSSGTAPQWATLSSAAVTSINFGTTGLTPSTPTAGAVTVAGTLAAANGGTGQSSYAVGDLLFASTTTALSKLADVATGNALISGGVGVAPSWGKIDLTAAVSGILPIANGGNNSNATPTAGSIHYGTGTAWAATAAGTTGQVLTSAGAGIPTWTTPTTGTVTSVGGTGTVSGITLSGTVTSSGNLTLGGTLAVTPSNFASQAANTFLAAPNGAAGVPTFRTVVAADIPTLNQNTTGSAGSVANALTMNNGGSGAASGTTFNGSAAQTISYNTIGAPSTTGTGASGTWGINVTGNAGTATTATTASNLTNFTAATSSNPSSVDSPTTLDVVGYCAQAALPFSQIDGGLYTAGYSTSWYHQIFGDFRTGQIAIRGKNLGTWQAWRTVLDSSNYTSYAPTLTGTGASGTWGINITGNAGTATTATTANNVSGIVAVANGGTGASNAASARANLGAGTGNGTVTSVAASAGTGISISGSPITSSGTLTITNTSPNIVTSTSGSPPYYAARAWVSFNGNGGISVGASVNVSSVVRNGGGNYTVNFATAMPDTEYVVSGSCNVNGASASILNMFGNGSAGVYGPTASAFTFTTMYSTGSGSVGDASYVKVVIFR